LIRADVLILGAGPTGAVAALNLAPTRRVILVEWKPQAARRIGEALPPAARRLLTEMGLFETFIAEGHAPCYGNRAVWGNVDPVDTDFLRDPDGHGWHLDRARFDGWLRRAAIARGAEILTPARLVAVEPGGEGWRAQLATARGQVDVAAAFAIDAGGRAAPLARRLGAQRRATDRLVCGWIHGGARPLGRGAGLTTVEAVEDGWFYTAPLPEERRVLAFLTDADLPAAVIARRCTSCRMRYRHARDPRGPRRKQIHPNRWRLYRRAQLGVGALRRGRLARCRRCQPEFRSVVGAGAAARAVHRPCRGRGGGCLPLGR